MVLVTKIGYWWCRNLVQAQNGKILLKHTYKKVKLGLREDKTVAYAKRPQLDRDRYFVGFISGHNKLTPRDALSPNKYHLYMFEIIVAILEYITKEQHFKT